MSEKTAVSAKSVIGKIAAAIVVLIVALVIYASTRPDQFHVERSLDIAAPPETLLALIEDFHRWPQWSPYENRDPHMQREFSGTNSGVGAVYEWNGDKNVGRGRMEIIEVQPASRVSIKLDFIEPFAAHNKATFTLAPHDAATTVTWAMDGPANLLSKIMGIFFDMDKMIGADFSAGLAKMKTVAPTAQQTTGTSPTQ